jgi:hypothetical protein
MNLNGISDPTWVAVISGASPVKFEFLGLQLLISNLRQRIRAGEITPAIAVNDVKLFFTKYSGLTAAQNDFNKIAKL